MDLLLWRHLQGWVGGTLGQVEGRQVWSILAGDTDIQSIEINSDQSSASETSQECPPKGPRGRNAVPVHVNSGRVPTKYHPKQDWMHKATGRFQEKTHFRSRINKRSAVFCVLFSFESQSSTQPNRYLNLVLVSVYFIIFINIYWINGSYTNTQRPVKFLALLLVVVTQCVALLQSCNIICASDVHIISFEYQKLSPSFKPSLQSVSSGWLIKIMSDFFQ